MTRDEARELAKVMIAYADGKDIEHRLYGDNKWAIFNGDNKDHYLSFDFSKYAYRIKKEPTYRPFKNEKECWEEMQKHSPFGWVNTLTSKYWLIEHIASFDTGFEVIIDGNYFKPEVAFKELTFIDGTPFGIKED